MWYGAESGVPTDPACTSQSRNKLQNGTSARKKVETRRERRWWFDITNDRGRHQGPTRNAIRLRFSAVLPFPVSTSFNPPSTYFSMETFLGAESTTEQILDALSLRVERQLSTCDQNLKNKGFQSMVRDQDAFTTLCWEPEY